MPTIQEKFTSRLFSLSVTLVAFLLFVPLAAASFNLTSGLETDLCTAPSYTGQAELIGRFIHNHFLFQSHHEYEFQLVAGQENQLPLSAAFQGLNQLLTLNFKSSDDAAQLPPNEINSRLIKIKINNYQAYCEGTPMVDFAGIDQNFKNSYGNFVLIQGNPEDLSDHTLLYKGEATISGMLQAPPTIDSNTPVPNPANNLYTLIVDAKDQPLLPLAARAQTDWQFNQQLKISNSAEKRSTLDQSANKTVIVTIDQYGLQNDGTPFVRLKTNFADVDGTNPFASAIQFLKSQNMASGYPDHTFKPDQPLNRAEFIKIALLSQLDPLSLEKPSACFPDVSADDWFASYVCTAKDGKVIEGYSDSNFHPENEVTVAEALKITMKIVGIQYNLTPLWSDGVMAKAKEKNLLTFEVTDPNTPLTRGQMASIIAALAKQ